MKSVRLIVLLVLFIFITACTALPPQNIPSDNAIEEAIRESDRDVVKLVHTEEVKGGVVAFYKKGVSNGGVKEAAGYIKKTLRGWEWVIGGEHSDSAAKGRLNDIS